MIRALVYADINLNVMDGSTIWLQSVTKFLATHGREVAVDLLLKQRLDRSIGERLDDPHQTRIHLIAPPQNELCDARTAPALIAARDAQHAYDIILCRGVSACWNIVRTLDVRGRLWAYLTDLPQDRIAPYLPHWRKINDIFEASGIVLCQTEAFRQFFELQWPVTCGKCRLLPPMIPAAFFESEMDWAALRARPLRLVYTGQIDKRWGMSTLIDVYRTLRQNGAPAELVVIGDKINAAADDPGFREGMLEFLRTGAGVRHAGALPRDEVRRRILDCSVGFCLREPEMDERLEISTKLLEYCALGLPVLLNRTSANVQLLGTDYPLYASDRDEALAVLGAAQRDPHLLERAGRLARQRVQGFRGERVAEDLRTTFDDIHERRARRRRGAAARVLVASHDLKFFAPLHRQIEGYLGCRLEIDHWAALGQHDEANSRRLAQRAEIIFCEWCAGNAVWYSRNLCDGQQLFIRFHRMEINTEFPEKVRIENVTRVIFVSEHLRRQACLKFGWPDDKTCVIPNSIHCADLRRAKTPDARFNLGMIGVVPMLKRLDLAVDVIEQLRAQDPRYRPFLRSRLPWDHRWIWAHREQREHYEHICERMRMSPSLRRGVIHDGFGPDVARWLSKIGFVLSLSDIESFHLAAAEGLASGAAPLILRREGAEDIFPPEFVFDSVAQIVDYVLAPRAEFPDDPLRAGQQWIAERYDESVIGPHWRELLAGRVPASAVSR